jgi:hypothetical protein
MEPHTHDAIFDQVDELVVFVHERDAPIIA